MGRGLLIKDIYFTYERTDFSIYVDELKIPRGKCVALRGMNGSGKTTIGQLITGIIKPDKGDIYLDDERINTWSLGKIGKEIAYLFQEPSKQIFAPTVIEEMTFSLIFKGIKKEKAEKEAKILLERFELHHLENQSTFTLSRGEKQRLAICAILLNKPSFLILDEPTTGLDDDRKEILFRLLENLKKEGIGILLISHDEIFTKKLAEESYWMKEGVLENGK